MLLLSYTTVIVQLISGRIYFRKPFLKIRYHIKLKIPRFSTLILTNHIKKHPCFVSLKNDNQSIHATSSSDKYLIRKCREVNKNAFTNLTISFDEKPASSKVLRNYKSRFFCNIVVRISKPKS